MKIVHVIGDGRLQGAGLQLSYLVSALSQNYEIEVVAPCGAPLLSRFEGTPIHTTALPVGGRAGFRPGDVRRFESHFLRTAPDIVHTHGNFSARLGAALAGVPCLLSTRHAPVGGAHRGLPLWAKVYNAVTTLTVTTFHTGEKRLFAEGIPKERILTIPNGVPPAVRPDETRTASLRESLGIGAEDTVIASFSGGQAEGGEESGQKVLLRAFARVAARKKKIFLLLAAGDGERQELRRLSSLLGIGERVSLLPEGTDPAPYLGFVSLYVEPSRGTEASALTVCTMMSLGIPTVAADTEEMHEIIGDGKNGLFFPPDNSYALAEVLVSLFFTPSRLLTLSRGAKERYLADFSLSRMEYAYEKLYDRMLSS